MMKKKQVVTVLSFLILMALIPAGCERKEAAAAGKNTDVPNTGNDLATGAKVTFVELGSVKCIPCRMMQPVMREIEEAYVGKVKVVFIDVMTDQGRPYAEKFGIQAIPTQVFLDAKGKELARHTGFFPKDSIVALLSSKGIL